MPAQLDVFDQEWWLPVVHFPDYEVSNQGRVRRATDSISGNFRKGYVLAIRMTSGRGEQYSYACTDLYRHGKPTKMRVHRMVARAFIGPDPNGRRHVDHINGDRECNAAWNLRWCSNLENQQYRASGTYSDDDYEAIEREAMMNEENERND